ncbi:hypothetical protein M9H77_26758 [Catharanthus roseus]|uniref:Uncharacterized protein n=1 Tax=Catharanthus roseus TaxID=4058 RepID=A0ACC0ACG3_CATRO|nr:hypothetical protein M9H77_26758 [Catharanthus roseus]
MSASLRNKREFLLKDFESRMGVNLELFKVNPLAFEKSNFRKDAFEQVGKYFVVEHLCYHKPFKGWLSKLVTSCASFGKNSITKTNESFEDEGQASKLLINYAINKDLSREQLGCEK